MKKKSEQTALLAAFICNFLWGLSFLASQFALDRASVPVLLSHRFLLAFLVMSMLLPLRPNDHHLRGRSIRPLLLLGLMEPVIYFLAELIGMVHSTTIFSGVMISMIPIVSILAAIPVLKEIPTAGQMFFCLLSVGGVIGIGLQTRSSGNLDWIGVTALLTAVFAAVIYTLLNRRIAADYTPFERTFVVLAVGAAAFTGIALVSVRGDMAAYLKPLTSVQYIISLLYLAVCCSVVCFFLSCYCFTRLPVARITVFANLTTAVSVLAGVLILHEPLSPIGFLFCVLILVGIYGVQRYSAKGVRPL